MQSYLYRNDDRIKSMYSQFVGKSVTKATTETSSAVEVGLGASLLSLLSPSIKGVKGSKNTVETAMAPEIMVSELIKGSSESWTVGRIVSKDDWNFIKRGDLVVFRGALEFDSFGRSKGELWRASYEELGQRKFQHDLRLKGPVGEKYVELPFSSNWVTGPSQFTVLCHAYFDSLEGIAVVMTDPDSDPVILQALAFGNGFITPT